MHIAKQFMQIVLVWLCGVETIYTSAGIVYYIHFIRMGELAGFKLTRNFDTVHVLRSESFNRTFCIHQFSLSLMWCWITYKYVLLLIPVILMLFYYLLFGALDLHSIHFSPSSFPIETNG